MLIAMCAWLDVPAPATGETAAGWPARLDEAIRRVEAARDGGASLGDPGDLFPETEEVPWGNGTMRVDHGDLLAEWHGVPAGGEARRQALDRLWHHLAAVRAVSATGEAAAAPPPPAAWQEKLSEVMRRPEFSKRQVQESLLGRLLQWVRDKLELLLPRGRGRDLNKVVGWILYVVAGGALLFMLGLLVRVALPLFLRERRAAPQGRPAGPTGPETPEGLRALAEGRARAGDFRGAVQAIFRWTLLTLHQAGRLEYDPALTNREHLARLKGDGTVRAAFEDLARQFELACYALRPVGSEDYDAFRSGCRILCGADIR